MAKVQGEDDVELLHSVICKMADRHDSESLKAMLTSVEANLVEVLRARHRLVQHQLQLQRAEEELRKLESGDTKPAHQLPTIGEWMDKHGASKRVRNLLSIKFGEDTRLDTLVRLTEAHLSRMPNIGRRSLNEVKELLAFEGLFLGMTDDHLKSAGLL